MEDLSSSEACGLRAWRLLGLLSVSTWDPGVGSKASALPHALSVCEGGTQASQRRPPLAAPECQPLPVSRVIFPCLFPAILAIAGAVANTWSLS